MPEGSGDGDAARCLYAQVRFVKPGRAISAEDTKIRGQIQILGKIGFKPMCVKR